MLKLTSTYQRIKLWYAVPVVLILILAGIYLLIHAHASSADINGDGKVDVRDLSVLASHYYDTGATFSEGDLNGDGKVDIFDLSILASQWHVTQTVYQPPASIASDCSADVTSALNTWIASVPNNTTIMLKANGCYRTDQTVTIDSKAGLTFEGNNATFQRVTPTPANLLYPNANPHMMVTNCTNITLKDFHILGLNTVSDIKPDDARTKLYVFESSKFGSGYGDKAFESGIHLITDTNIAMDNVSTDGTYGDGLTVGSQSSAGLVKNLTVTNLTIDRNGRQGVAFSALNNAVLNNIKILHSHAVGFDAEPDGATNTVNGLEIENSYINSYTVALSWAGTADISNLNIHNNEIKAEDPVYPWFYGIGGSASTPKRQNWQVNNNTVDIPTKSLSFYNLNGITVKNNISPAYQSGTVGVQLFNATGLTSTGNTFAAATSSTAADSTSSITSDCGNRLTATGAFNFPALCP